MPDVTARAPRFQQVRSVWLYSGLVFASGLSCYLGNGRGEDHVSPDASAEAGGAPAQAGAGGSTDLKTGGTGGTTTGAGGSDGNGGTVGTGGTGPVTATGGASFGSPTFSTNFADLDGWNLINRRGDGASISVESHPSSDDNSVLALHFPGNPVLGANDFRNPAYAVEVATTDNTLHYGRFELRVRFASCAADEELVNGIFTYFNDGSDQNGNGIGDNSEIDIELLCGEPQLLWLTVWTDYQTNPSVAFRKTTRVIDMRNGNYHQTRAGMEGVYDVAPGGRLPGITETDFPNPNRFYVLGFDWQPSYVRYYATLGGSEVELFRLDGSARVPQRPGRFLLNLWHAHVHWMKGGAADYPKVSTTMHVDWVRIWQ